jgi:hypothetical protein
MRAIPIFLLLLLPLAAKAEEQTWYVQRITAGDTPVSVEHFWSKGARLRAETVVAGRPILTLVNGELYTVVDRLSGTGLAIRRRPQAVREDAERERPFGNEADQLLADGAEKVGSEDLHGRRCSVYRLTDRSGRREACLDVEPPHLPRRFEQFDRSSGRRAEVRYIDWLHGFEVPDAFFEPDPRFSLERIEYEEYLDRAGRGPLGPAPVFFRDLLHGHP